MEDFYETRIDSVDGQIIGLFGVFDGMYEFVTFVHNLYPLIILYHFRKEHF